MLNNEPLLGSVKLPGWSQNQKYIYLSKQKNKNSCVFIKSKIPQKALKNLQNDSKQIKTKKIVKKV